MVRETPISRVRLSTLSVPLTLMLCMSVGALWEMPGTYQPALLTATSQPVMPNRMVSRNASNL